MDDQKKKKNHIDLKDPSKGTAPNNYRPINYVPMMWKILTAQIREKIYYSPLQAVNCSLRNRKDVA